MTKSLDLLNITHLLLLSSLCGETHDITDYDTHSAIVCVLGSVSLGMRVEHCVANGYHPCTPIHCKPEQILSRSSSVPVVYARG